MSRINDKLLEYFLNPRNVGIIEKPDGYARVENPVNGYTTDIYLRVEKDRIQDIKFKTLGCTATIASASVLTESVKGGNLDDIVDGGKTLEKLMGLVGEKLGNIPKNSWHCPPTAIQALIAAIFDYYEKTKNEKKVEMVEKIIIDIKKYFQNILGCQQH